MPDPSIPSAGMMTPLDAVEEKIKAVKSFEDRLGNRIFLKYRNEPNDVFGSRELLETPLRQPANKNTIMRNEFKYLHNDIIFSILPQYFPVNATENAFSVSERFALLFPASIIKLTVPVSQ